MLCFLKTAIAAGFVVLLASCAAEPVAGLNPLTANLSQPVERASSDDCAIIVEIGKAELNWGSKPPRASFLPRYNEPGGGTYLEDCPWKKLGVAEPQIGGPNAEMRFFITRPVYSGTDASAGLEYSISPKTGPNGKKISPFIEGKSCTLKKIGDRWHLVACRIDYIT